MKEKLIIQLLGEHKIKDWIGGKDGHEAEIDAHYLIFSSDYINEERQPIIDELYEFLKSKGWEQKYT